MKKLILLIPIIIIILTILWFNGGNKYFWQKYYNENSPKYLYFKADEFESKGKLITAIRYNKMAYRIGGAKDRYLYILSKIYYVMKNYKLAIKYAKKVKAMHYGKSMWGVDFLIKDSKMRIEIRDHTEKLLKEKNKEKKVKIDI